jgi:iron complex transport system ATP-binding protein
MLSYPEEVDTRQQLATKEVLIVSGLAIGYSSPPRTLAENINLSLEGGELVCLLGPNGVGKSTLIRTMAGMHKALHGQIRLMGTDIGKLKPRDLAKRLSVVLTDKVDVGILTAYSLVALGRYPYTNWSGKLSAHDEAVVQWAIEAVGATALAKRNVNELSDGERQKIMIARALAQEPGLIILDEPTAYLDLPRRVEVMQTLRKLARETGRAVLLSTHDLDLALRSADKIWLLSSNGQLSVGAPEDLILAGAFQAAFRNEGVDFDNFSGAFKVNSEYKGQIALQGSGMAVIWTARALERAGFEITPDATVLVEVAGSDSGWFWQVQAKGQMQNFSSVYALVKSLQQKAKGLSYQACHHE